MSVVLTNVTASKVTFMIFEIMTNVTLIFEIIDKCNIGQIYFISLLKQKYTEEVKLNKRVVSIV